jgi:hypothetical protein
MARACPSKAFQTLDFGFRREDSLRARRNGGPVPPVRRQPLWGESPLACEVAARLGEWVLSTLVAVSALR